ncbi:MAG: T9SS type A sorting domain-containing protein [Bacteroidota bacterium]
MKRIIRLFAAVMALCFFTPVSANIIFVSTTANGSADGSSWENAFTDLQDAIDAAQAGDELWVAQGTYSPSRDQQGNTQDIRTYTFFLNKNIAVYGGFQGIENIKGQRNPLWYRTTLSGDLGQAGQGQDDAYHVVFIEQVSDLVLDGFVIEDGAAEGSGIDQNGGGILLQQSSNVLFNHLGLLGNYAQGGGGGVYTSQCSNIKMYNMLLCGNQAGQHGGAIYNVQVSNWISVNNILFQNTASQHGGAFFNEASSHLTITNATVLSNQAGANGGGSCNQQMNDFHVYNSIFWDNSDQAGLGHAAAQGFQGSGCTNMSYSHSLVQGSLGSGASWNAPFSDAGNNLDFDPLIADAFGLDYVPCTDDDRFGLAAGSPALNAGDNAAPGIVGLQFDFADAARVQDGLIDMGACEGIAAATFPVEWLSVEGRWERNGDLPVAVIEWSTAREENSDRFVVERAINLTNDEWTAVGSLAAAGNSNDVRSYRLDDSPFFSQQEARNLVYRIRQIDIDGTTSFSQSIVLAAADLNAFGEMTVFPNPTAGNLSLQVQLPKGQTTERLRIFNTAGQLVVDRALSQKEVLFTDIDLSHLPGGMYVVQLSFTDGQLQKNIHKL